MASDNKREFTGIILFFFAIILTLMFYLPSKVTGLVGDFLRSIGFGLLGTVALILPFFLFYASADFFIEKREGVAPIRVKSIIVLVLCVSALLTSFTLDTDYFRSLCVTPDGKYSAFEAVKLLWTSGQDGSLITPVGYATTAIPGGFLGGGIALSLITVCGKPVTNVILVAVIILQIVIIFNISVKRTAKKITNATQGAINKARRQVSGRSYTGNGSGYPQGGNPSYSNRSYSNVNAGNTVSIPVSAMNGNSPFVKGPASSGETEVPIINPSYDAFNVSKFPVDAATGFADVSSSMPGGVTPESHPDQLSYGERLVNTNQESNTADFSFDSKPKNPPLYMPKDKKKLSFLEKEQKQDFYDLGDGNPSSEYSSVSMKPSYEPRHDYYCDEDIIEVNGGSDSEIYEIKGTNSARSETPEVRRPNVDMSVFGGDEDNENFLFEIKDAQQSTSSGTVSSASSNPVVSEANNSEMLSRDIRINSENDMKSLRDTQVRQIDTGTGNDNNSGKTVSFEASETKTVRKKYQGPYRPAPSNLLSADKSSSLNANDDKLLRQKALKLEEALKSFGVVSKVINITHGPAITRFELELATGIKVSKITNLADDIQLAMAATSVRIEAPIPGKSAIGIEIPNDKTSAVHLRGLIETKEFREATPLTVALGRDIPGKPILCDLAKMPHLLIAGSTGSGKSVCINSILSSILCKASPEEVKMILIDPKVVELAVYNGIPHLIMPVVTNPKKAAGTLKWAVEEMTRRYDLFAENSVRDIKGYNEFLKYQGEKPLPLILIVIDELADLMTVAAKEVEGHISRLAAMARAAGLHLLIATQRPSVDVITGVIKSNIPSRIAFAVSSGVDSRTILDSYGAEKLLGKGDMLYAPLSAPKPIRGQGAFLKDEEVVTLVDFLSKRYGTEYDESIIRKIDSAAEDGQSSSGDVGKGADTDGGDELLEQAVDIIIEQNAASVSILQRRLGIGYPRAARLIDVMEQKHIIGPFEGSKPRKVLINRTDWLEMKARGENK